MLAVKRTSTTSSSLPATVRKSMAPTVEAARRNPLFAPGEDVEVRCRFPQVSGKTQLVIVMYERAKVVSASAGTQSYLVQYPASDSIPGRVARVAASDVRAARGVQPPLDSAALDVARPASSKRPLPSEEKTERGGGGDSCKKAKKTGKGILMDALPLRRFSAEHEKEEEAKKKKARGYRAAESTAPKLIPASVKGAVAKRKVVAPEKSNNVTLMAANGTTNTAPPRLPATVRESMAPTAETARRKPRFVRGEDVEVRSGFSQVSGKVIYAPAKVVSASAGTDSYLVRYPATNSIPSCTARVAASEVRAARRVPPPPDSALDAP